MVCHMKVTRELVQRIAMTGRLSRTGKPMTKMHLDGNNNISAAKAMTGQDGTQISKLKLKRKKGRKEGELHQIRCLQDLTQTRVEMAVAKGLCRAF